ncbi:MAG: hypothetical protein ACU841_17900 [Gammaproteobacteria bacterium]
MVDSYIVRIYRRAGDNTPLAGVVEDTRWGTRQGFLNRSELWDILSGGSASENGAGRAQRTPPGRR